MGSASHWTREEPLPLGLDTNRLPFLQFENEAPFERNFVLRVLGLQLVESLADC